MAAKRSGGGFETLRKSLNDLSKLQAKTGWPENATYADGTKVVDVAQWNEFGSKKTPPRSFVRLSVAENGQKWSDTLGRGAKACISGKASARTVLESTAMLAAADIGKTAKTVTSPPLKPQTIRRKGFDMLLVDSGKMLQTVTGIVEDA